MRTFARLVLAFIAASLVLLLAAYLSPAVAQGTTPSRCGAHAAGKMADGRMWVGAAPRMWVGRDGYWHVCQPWVPDGGDPEMPEPRSEATCPAGTVIERWVQDGRECLGDVHLPAIRAGRAVVLIDSRGGTRGMAAFRCQATDAQASGAAWKLEGYHCHLLYPPADPTAPDKQRRHKMGDAKVGAASWPRR